MGERSSVGRMLPEVVDVSLTNDGPPRRAVGTCNYGADGSGPDLR